MKIPGVGDSYPDREFTQMEEALFFKNTVGTYVDIRRHDGASVATAGLGKGRMHKTTLPGKSMYKITFTQGDRAITKECVFVAKSS